MDKYQEEIERFIEDLMAPEEKASFQQRLTAEPELAEALKEEISARALITDAGRLDILDKLEGYEAEINKRNTGFVIPLWTKRLLPIAAMLVIFFGVYNFFIGNKLTTTEVYDTYFESYSAPSVDRAEIDSLQYWNLASKLYSEKKFSEARMTFAQAENEMPNYLISFYRGMCDLSIEAPYFQRAIEAFDIVLETDNDFNEQARWYKALALLQIQKKQEADAILQEIVANKSFNHTKAEMLLKEKIKY